jgi:Protein of unknown function (DUF3224)
MRDSSRSIAGRAGVVALVCLCAGLSVAARGEVNAQGREGAKGDAVTNHAAGTFEVKVTPAANEKAGDAAIGRFLLDKQFQGDLDGTSKGEMLGASTSVKGSAAYVALEHVSGTLKGRKGSSILQHTGTMTRGALQMTVTVVPDSGTEQLTGIAGTMTIKIVDGKHFYDFEYTLPQNP